ncbi:cation transporter [Rickettsiales bacterium]|jgi:Co/Zn/Cd efflux system component|nr:cation transporter [Rickettsiales bacterium]
MPNNCCDSNEHNWDCKYRVILWVVLFINFGMFILEVFLGLLSGSQSLLADSLDFFADSANYGISLYVLSKSITLRAKASLIKGYTMGVLGVFVAISTIYKVFFAVTPKAEIIGMVGFVALAANVFSAFLLYKYRKGDSNRASVWICSRNDAIANIAVIFAGLGVWITNTKWPDLAVAFIIASISLSGAYHVIKKAKKELEVRKVIN